MIATIIITFWTTCAIIYVTKERAHPFSASRSYLIIFEIIFAPYQIYQDIKDEWVKLKELRDRYLNEQPTKPLLTGWFFVLVYIVCYSYLV